MARQGGAGPIEAGRVDGDPSTRPGRAGPPRRPSAISAPLRRAFRGLSGWDVAVVVVLLVAAALMRRGLPRDGLWYDDAWVVVGAGRAGYDDLFAVSTNHPGFTALLMTWARLVSRRTESFVVPTLVAGVVAPAVAYLVFARLRVERFVSFAAATLLVVAPAHVVYSARVKPYTIETVTVFLVMAAVAGLAGRRWRWRTAAGWVILTVAVSTLSAFTAVIVGVATLVLAAHPRRDLSRRLAALVAQGGAQLVLLLYLGGRYDSAQVAEDWETTYDGYIELDDPLSVPRQVVTHVRRLGQAILDVGSLPALLIALVGLAGLTWASVRGDRTRAVTARFLAALLVVALAGSLVRQIPFGPSVGNPIFPGGRATLWLLPSLLGGLAFAGDAAVRGIAAARGPTAGRAVAAVATAGVLVVAAIHADAPPPYRLGTATLARFADEQLADGDVLIVIPNATWTYSAEPSAEVSIRSEPGTVQGFVPVFRRPRTYEGVPDNASPQAVRALVASADKVVVVNGAVGFGDPRLLDGSLEQLGFERSDEVEVGGARATAWTRSR